MATSKSKSVATKVFTTTNGESFRVDSSHASLIREMGNIGFRRSGNKMYLRSNSTDEYVARVVAEKVFGNLRGKRVSFRDGNPLNLTSKNLLVC